VPQRHGCLRLNIQVVLDVFKYPRGEIASRATAIEGKNSELTCFLRSDQMPGLTNMNTIASMIGAFCSFGRAEPTTQTDDQHDEALRARCPGALPSNAHSGQIGMKAISVSFVSSPDVRYRAHARNDDQVDHERD
jgi:hypothetical protein